jgi:CRISPR-associated protein Csx10
VQYANAYITDADCKKLLPVPGSFVRKKDSDVDYDLAYENDWKEVINADDIQTQKPAGHFCLINKDDSPCSILSLNPATEMEYHHQRPKDRSIGHAREDKDDAGEFFQFEVLKKDQCFKGMITGIRDDLAKLKKLIPDNSTIHLGKSRTAQYGNAKISYEAATEFTGEIHRENGIISKDDDYFVITLTSPMILQNEYGHYLPDPDIFLGELKKRLKITDDAFLKISDTNNSSFLRFIKVGGFMAKWGLPRQQATALDAGSVIICQYTGDTEILIFDIEKNGYGERVEQDFGRVIVDWHGRKKIRSAEFEFPEGIIEFPSCFKELGVQIIRQQLEMWVKEKAIDVYDIVKKSYTDKEILTNSLIGRLMTIFSNSENFNDINANISSFKDKANDKLQALNLKIGNSSDSLQSWLKVFCNGSNTEFKRLVIAHTNFHNIDVRNILNELHITDNDIIEPFELVKSFFIIFFKCFIFHNRELKTDE